MLILLFYLYRLPKVREATAYMDSKVTKFTGMKELAFFRSGVKGEFYVLYLVINRTAVGRAQFLLCTGFIIIICSHFFVGGQNQTSTRPNLIEALDSKGILNTLKKVSCQPWNARMLHLSLLLCDK